MCPLKLTNNAKTPFLFSILLNLLLPFCVWRMEKQKCSMAAQWTAKDAFGDLNTGLTSRYITASRLDFALLWMKWKIKYIFMCIWKKSFISSQLNMWCSMRKTKKFALLGLNKSSVNDSLFDFLNVHGTTGFFQHNLHDREEIHTFTSTLSTYNLI